MKLLWRRRRHPRYVTLLAPLVTYTMRLLAGTGDTAFSTLPMIAEVAKEQRVHTSRPLSIAVVSSQITITASPLSTAVVFFASLLLPAILSTMIGLFLRQASD